jgi:hypothetical protein
VSYTFEDPFDYHLLFPKLDMSPARYFTGIVESLTGKFTASPKSYQFWCEGIVELPSEHPLFLGQNSGESHIRKTWTYTTRLFFVGRQCSISAIEASYCGRVGK